MTLHLVDRPDLPPCGDTPPLVGGGDNPADTPAPQAKAGKGKTDLYQSVTDSIIKQLEAGAVPWVQPWGRPDSETPFGLPTNGDTGNAYSGVNILLLWGAAIENQRTTQTWLTYKQALKRGGQVRKGEIGTTICYASSFIPKNEKLRAQENGTDAQSIGFLKKYTVFNADQCEGLGEEFFKDVQPLPEREAIPAAERLIQTTRADFRVGGDRAFFAPHEDFIQVPPQQAFFDQINYYRTCFHELGHWSGHKSRLDRNLKGKKGSKDYAREELVAEMATAFICASLGIVPTVRHTDYLAAWHKVLKEDKRAIFRAASLASKAADYILKFQTPKKSDAAALSQMEIAA